jgi:hypothetical protein
MVDTFAQQIWIDPQIDFLQTVFPLPVPRKAVSAMDRRTACTGKFTITTT